MNTVIYVNYRKYFAQNKPVRDGCGEQNKLKLENVRYMYEAGRVLCGAIKGTGRDHVYGEFGWELLSSRRYRRRMMIFHSILYSYCPQHLFNIIQGTVGERTNYRLRNVHQLNTFYCRSTTFYNSFFPKCVSDWNEILSVNKNLDDRAVLNDLLRSNLPDVNPLFFIGQRRCSIVHTQMRMGCSSLNYDLSQMHLINSQKCNCGFEKDVHHFFLTCPFYVQQRTLLYKSINQYIIIW